MTDYMDEILAEAAIYDDDAFDDSMREALGLELKGYCEHCGNDVWDKKSEEYGLMVYCLGCRHP